MPLLRALEEEFSADKPFKGLKVALSVHLEAKTAYLCRVLAAGGANMQARLTIKTIFKIDSLTTRYRLPAFTADDHLFARTLDGTIAPQLIAAADTPSRSSDGQLRVFSMSLQDREIAVIIIVRIM